MSSKLRGVVIRIVFSILIALAAATGITAALILWFPPARQVTTSGIAKIGGPFTLVSSNGQVVTDKTYRGKWLALFFGYTYCPDVCPTTLSNMSIALDALGVEADKLQPAFVTVDPKRDTREILADYLKSFNSKIIGLTGTQDQVDDIVSEYRVYVAQQKSDPEDKDYLVAHSAYIYLMDPKGKFVSVMQGTESGKAIAAWLRKEMKSST